MSVSEGFWTFPRERLELSHRGYLRAGALPRLERRARLALAANARAFADLARAFEQALEAFAAVFEAACEALAPVVRALARLARAVEGRADALALRARPVPAPRLTVTSTYRTAVHQQIAAQAALREATARAGALRHSRGGRAPG